MNCQAILKQNHSKILPDFIDISPFSDSTVTLNMCLLRIVNNLLNPFSFDLYSIFSLPCIKKLLSIFHLALLTLISAYSI